MMRPMKSAWVDSAAAEMTAQYEKAGIGRDLALRVYTSRLLGRDKRLVLHGGGNTSLKTRLPDLMGDDADVLCVKGSGWDLAEIEPPGLPAVRLGPLQGLRRLDALSDEDMVRVQRANLLDPMAPNPSVETLLHAFLPHAYVDHTHATAVLSIADQPDGAARCIELYGKRMGLVPYILPGFALAKKAAEMYEADPEVEGLVLLKHGIFTFGASAREAYERMIEMVTLAEDRLARRRNVIFLGRTLPSHLASVAEIAPILRGACSQKDKKIEGAHLRLILEFRSDPAILDYVNGAELERYAGAGVVTPDHTIRTKNYPLIVPPPEAGKLDDFATAVRAAAEKFVAEYEAYFARHNAHGPAHARPAAAGDPGAGARALRAGAQRQGRGRRRRHRRERDRDHHRRRSHRPLRIAVAGRALRHGILVARAGEARQGAGQDCWPARSR